MQATRRRRNVVAWRLGSKTQGIDDTGVAARAKKAGRMATGHADPPTVGSAPAKVGSCGNVPSQLFETGENTIGTTERFLVAMAIIYTVPYLVWRLGRTDYFAPLVVVQVVMGIVLGPGVLGALLPEYHAFVFTPEVVHGLDGIAWWAVMLFVFLAGVELDIGEAWRHRRENALTAGLALGAPLLLGSAGALVLLGFGGWIGADARPWQFVLGVGMACAVTALPVLLLLMDRLAILREPLGQRILRYASLDDIAIWGVLALILMEWQRVGYQVLFLAAFALGTLALRRIMPRLAESDRWYVIPIWLVLSAIGADWCGLHYMVGAFLAGAVVDRRWFDGEQLDRLRHDVLLALMPVYFLSTGLRTDFEVGGAAVFLAAGLLLCASVAGKLAGVHLAARLLRWSPGDASIIGWLLQTKGLIMIVFVSMLLDKRLISAEAFTALLLMSVASTMLTTPMVAPRLARLRGLAQRGA
jgi:Kef-type K+ transport system membrane component KefB